MNPVVFVFTLKKWHMKKAFLYDSYDMIVLTLIPAAAGLQGWN